MSKANKVKMADILIRAGASIRGALDLCGIPLPVKIEVRADAVHSHQVKILDENKSRYLKGETFFLKGTEPLPLKSYVESMPENDGSSSWSISKSELIVTYAQSFKKVYFGSESSGSQTDPRIPVIHRISVPMAEGWPDLTTISPRYPITA